MNSSDKRSEAETLRHKAEELLEKKPSKAALQLSQADMLKLVHELEVHQIELEMQNEELVKARMEALEAAEKYADLYDFAPSGYFTLSKDGEIIELNFAGAQMLAKERSYLKNSTLGFFISDDTKPAYAQFLGKIFKSETMQDCEAALLVSDGEKRYVHLKGIVAQSGQICLVSMIDITTRVQAEIYKEIGSEILQILNEPGDLRKSVGRIISLFRTKAGFDAAGIRLQDGNDFPYFVQEGFPDDFLLTENTLAERTADGGVCLDKDGNVSLECTCGLVLSGKADLSNPLFTKGGSFWVNDSFPLLNLPLDQDPRLHPRNNCINKGYASVALVPIRNKDKIVGLIQLNDRRKDRFTLEIVQLIETIATTIGQSLIRRQAEDAVRASEKQITMITENLPAFIGYFDQEQHLRFLNRAGEDLFGLPRADFIGKHMKVLLGEEYYNGNIEEIKSALSGQKISFESQMSVRNGERVVLSVNYVPDINDSGMVKGVYVLANDITERKLAEDVLKRDDESLRKLVSEQSHSLLSAQVELEQGKRLSDIGLLAANVSHELRNPLAAIRLALHNIRRKSTNSDIDKHLATIDKKIQESDQIINNLLLFSRLKPPSYESVNIFDIIEECSEALQRYTNKEITETKDMDSLKDIMIEADPTQLKEVFNNLLNNAFDALPAKNGLIKIIGENENEFVKVSIEDNGSGIADDILDKIFIPFFSMKAKGTGLGLPICRQIVNMHEGTIEVKSKIGQGTSVIVRLPKQRASK